MSFLPRSRTQEYQNNNNGTQTVRCYSPLNPHYYKDSNGVVVTENDILHDIMETVKATPNNMELGKKIRNIYLGSLYVSGILSKRIR